MRFWDTSALVPLVLEQESTETVTRLLDADPEIAAWWGSAVECASAAARLRREERITVEEEGQALAIVRRLRDSWMEVLPSEEVLEQATRLLRVHPLRAADALQLAAARVWAGSEGGAGFVTFDERLGLGARLEGFRVLPES